MEAVLVILAVFSVPLVAITSSTWLKYKKLQLDAGGAASPETTRRLRMLEQENADLRQRVENLETIATGLPASVGLEAGHKTKELEAHKDR